MNNKIKTITFHLTSLFCLQVFACTRENEFQSIEKQGETENTETLKLKITIGTASFSATLQNNATARAFIKRLPLTLSMKELNNNEKYAELNQNLPTNASNPKTIENGDLMLYGSNTLVLFIKHFRPRTTTPKLEK